MGIAASAALLFVILAYLAQSPRQLARYRWLAFRLAGRGRSLTGYGLASLLVALGFFLAGIPIGAESPIDSSQETAAILTPSSQPQETVGDNTPEATIAPIAEDGDPDQDLANTPESGSFARPPTATPVDGESQSGDDSQESVAVNTAEGTAESPSATPRPVATATPSPTATSSPTPTATPSPTVTPTPTLTPTPILGETAIVDTTSSTLWVRRTPAGDQLELVFNGDVVILENEQQASGGILWQLVRTVNGNLGWVQADFLLNPDVPDEDSDEN
ncbi:MAG: hypothetical protein QNJ45_09375 [Ardenticatenaceae bacterium]|nr:hypothetical protein [Ardenticatenaceae bacterium]